MINKKDDNRTIQEISTASLPDIIFILLFFFMVVTVLRTTEEKLSIVLPKATELTKLEQKSLVNHILIGSPNEQYKNPNDRATRIQLNDKFSEIQDIPLFLKRHIAQVPEKMRGRIRTSLKIDKEVTMGIVEDVKLELRKSNQLAINYATLKKE